jgi:predicted neuraminidase
VSEFIYETESCDDGETWSELKPMKIPNNNSGPDGVTLRGGRHALVYNHIGRIPGKWSSLRTPLNVSISNDGENWNGAMVLKSKKGEYSYPAIIQTSDGLIHISYTWQRKKIRHWSIDPNQLRGAPIVEGEWPHKL